MNDASSLGQYGLIGVMLALIALTGSSIWILWKLVGNHIDHNTAAMGRNTEAFVAFTRVNERLSTLIETKLK